MEEFGRAFPEAFKRLIDPNQFSNKTKAILIIINIYIIENDNKEF